MSEKKIRNLYLVGSTQFRSYEGKRKSSNQIIKIGDH